jgi:GNAT superfamily N-acetyltransferase
VYPAPDRKLAQRLERAEAMANAAFVEARAGLQPDAGAQWIEIAGAYAMFDGVASPITQTFGMGVFDPFGEREFERVEEFFGVRGAATAHEVCSYADHATLQLLSTRGYTPIEASVVLVQPTARHLAAPVDRIVARRIDASEADEWSRVSVRGWSSEAPQLSSFLEEMGAITTRARDVHCFLAEMGGQPVAAAALSLQNGVALMAGACTIPEARRLGAQRALLDARLALAATLGSDLAMVVTAPGSSSQRNAERHGFRPMYTRSKWQRSAP